MFPANPTTVLLPADGDYGDYQGFVVTDDNVEFSGAEHEAEVMARDFQVLERVADHLEPLLDAGALQNAGYSNSKNVMGLVKVHGNYGARYRGRLLPRPKQLVLRQLLPSTNHTE